MHWDTLKIKLLVAEVEIQLSCLVIFIIGTLLGFKDNGLRKIMRKRVSNLISKTSL